MQLFRISDLDGSKSISFREFIIAVAIGYYLKPGVETQADDPNFQENRRAFKVVQDAFNKIDADGGGKNNLPNSYF